MSKRKKVIIRGEEYTLVKTIPADSVNEHHIIWKKHYKQYNVNEQINKVLMSERKHCALNKLVWEGQSPHEQLKIMLEIWEPVLSDRVKSELYNILSLPRWAFYKEELVKKRYQNRELFSDNVCSNFYIDNDTNNEWL